MFAWNFDYNGFEWCFKNELNQHERNCLKSPALKINWTFFVVVIIFIYIFFNVYHSQHIIALRYSQTFMKSDYTTLEKCCRVLIIASEKIKQ